MAFATDDRRAASLLARIERTQVSPWHIRALVVMGSATFFDAFDVLAIAYVLPSLIGVWKLAPRTIGILISSSFLGQIVGALFFGWLAERIGRLRCAKITIALYSLMSLLCAVSWNIPSLLLFRTIQGIGLGGEVPVAAAYINEISRAKGRGRFFLLYQLIFPIGLVGASLLGFWLVPLFGWRTMFLIGGLPAILVFVLFAGNILPESPRWLVSKGRFEEAELIVGQMESAARSSGAVISSAPEPLPIAPAPRRETSRLELFRGIYRLRTIVVWFIWITTYFVTYGVNTWLPTIFRTYYKYSVADALRYGVIINLAGLAGAFCCAMLVDRLGRRPWFILAYAFGAAPLIAHLGSGRCQSARSHRSGGDQLHVHFRKFDAGLFVYDRNLSDAVAKSRNRCGERVVASCFGGWTGDCRIRSDRLRSERRVSIVWNNLARRRGNFFRHCGNARASARGNLALKQCGRCLQEGKRGQITVPAGRCCFSPGLFSSGTCCLRRHRFPFHSSDNRRARL